MLHTTEQQQVRLTDREKELEKLIKENEALKAHYEEITNNEKIKQQYNTLKLQNKIKKEELDYLKETERKFKQIIQEWKKAENKQEVIKTAENLLFKRKQIDANAAAAKKADKLYQVVEGYPNIGDLVRHKTTHQIGKVIGYKDKYGIVQIGNLPFTVSLIEWVVVVKKEA